MTRHLALVGPTATGKSELALAIARARSGVEIVSLDSMQVYRAMDIGTAKPTLDERRSVPHHLVDVADPAEDWSVVHTQARAHEAIAEIEARGNCALLVGGTGLYVRAVVDAFTIPGHDDDLRRAIDAEIDDAGLAAAYDRLRALDPVAAARIEPANRRRIVRALEVITATGRPFSSFGPGVDAYDAPRLDVTMVGLWMPRAMLARRIAERVATMREAGLLAEVQQLAVRPGGLSRTAQQAIGYKELLAYVRGDEPSVDAAFDLAVRRTQQFARRQRVWFRRDPRVVWLGATANIDALTGAALTAWEAQSPVKAPS